MDVLFITATEQLKLNSISNGTMLLATKLIQEGFDVDILRYCQIKSFKKNYSIFMSN